MRRSPTGLLWGKGPHTCLDPGLESFGPQWCLEASTLCLAAKEICLGMGNEETEQCKFPSAGATPD